MSVVKSSTLLATLILLWEILSSQVQATGFSQPKTVIAQSTTTSGQSVSTELSLCPADLPNSIREIIDQPHLRRSRWGIHLQRLASEEILYQLNAEDFFTPASNAKLFTTAAALQTLGSDFRIRTPIYATGKAPDLATLKLVGQGDPSLTTEKLQILVEQLQQLGVKKIGKLILEDSDFGTARVNPTWEWEDLLFYYAAPISSLILNENAVILKLFPEAINQPLRLEWSDLIAAKQWKVNNEAIASQEDSHDNVSITARPWQSQLNIQGSLAIDSLPDTFGLAIPHPGRYFLATLEQLLTEAGIEVEQAILSSAKLPHGSEQPIITLVSDTLGELIQTINQESHNLYAEALRQTLITKTNKNDKDNPLSQPLSELGVDSSTYQLIDGSGLSRRNLVSPKSLGQLLISINQAPTLQVYRDSLAVSGQSGTLKNRFQDSEITNHFTGKTGTLTGISALSGYLEPKTFPELVVTILVNQSDQPASVLRRAIDQIIQRIYYLDPLGC